MMAIKANIKMKTNRQGKSCFLRQIRGVLMGVVLLIVMLWNPLKVNAQQDVYDRFAPYEDLTVAMVRNFPVDSIHKVDVLLIQAHDDQSWGRICEELEIRQLAGEKGAETAPFLVDMRDSRNPAKHAPIVNEKVDVKHSCQLGADRRDKAVYIFFSRTEEQCKIIFGFLIEKFLK